MVLWKKVPVMITFHTLSATGMIITACVFTSPRFRIRIWVGISPPDHTYTELNSMPTITTVEMK